jgi:nicotinamidase-related amidase
MPASMLDPNTALIGGRRVNASPLGHEMIGTDLEASVRTAGVTRVVLCGVAAGIGVESTARHAYDNVTLAADAMTEMNADAANSVSRIFPRLGETAATQEIIGLLDKPARPRSAVEQAKVTS